MRRSRGRKQDARAGRSSFPNTDRCAEVGVAAEEFDFVLRPASASHACKECGESAKFW